jgi:hypothetical protein
MEKIGENIPQGSFLLIKENSELEKFTCNIKLRSG